MSGSIYLGSDAYQGFSVQTARGTAVAPANFVRWSEESTFEPEPDVEYIPRGGDSRDVSTEILKMWSVNGELPYHLEPIMGAKLLTLALGKAPIAGTDVASGGGSTLSAPAAAGASEITLTDVTGYAINDLIQLEADYHDKSEIHKITAIDTNTLTLQEPLLFAHAAGVACNEVEAPFTHRILPALYQPWFTMERAVGLGMTTPIVERAIDCKVSEFTITGEAGGLVLATFSWMGTKSVANVAAATVAYPVEQGLFRIPGSTFTKEGSAIHTVRSWELKLNQGLIDDIQTDQIYRHDVVEGMRELEASMTVILEDPNLYRRSKYTDSTWDGMITELFSGDWVWTTAINAGNTLTITIPDVRYAKAPLPINAETSPCEVEVECRAMKPANDDLMKIEIKNSDYVREA